jgi:hypothetical protein
LSNDCFEAAVRCGAASGRVLKLPRGLLPVEQASKYELVINLKTTKAFGLSADHSTPRTDHAQAQRTYWCFIGQPVGIHDRAVMAVSRTAVEEQVAAAVRASSLLPPP